jgi:hypothetical protein
MPLIRLRRLLVQGRLRFDKFGEIDYGVHSLPQQQSILVDIDRRDDPRLRFNSIASIIRVIGITAETFCYIKTRRGWHIVIVCAEKFTELERICLQSILGDDEMRGALNFMRYWQSKGAKVPAFWKKRSNILYRRKLS